MAPLSLAVVLALSAIASSDTTQKTWGSVVFVYHGEKEPSLVNDGYTLTSLGASQLLEAGSVVRARYVSPTMENESNITSPAPINGMSSLIDNTQLSITSTGDEFVTGSALAFMQGLYPPAWSYNVHNYLSNLTYLQYPLGGYQYPKIATANANDLDYIWVAGNQKCTTYSISEIQTLSSAEYAAKVANTTAFYDSIALSVFPNLNPGIVNYDRAYDLYEYALYQYNHNSSSEISIEDLTQLHQLAAEQQNEVNTPNSFGTIASIAGQTLASRVLQQFNGIVGSNGVSDKLTFLFGSYEPFLSFFVLSKLNQGPSASRFLNSLPAHGSIMSFELFSNVEEGSTFDPTTPFPSTDDLWVRFLFRNGTIETEQLISYALFGRPNAETDMTYSDFVTNMGDFSLNDPADWCSACQSTTTWCQATLLVDLDVCENEDKMGKKLSPVIGGVIGATLTIGLFIICAIVLLLFGFRLDYHEKRAKGADGTEGGGIGVLKRTGSGGGFKGAEKLASDTDLRLKGGAGATIVRHERVGSWELNESPMDPKHFSLDKEIESERVKSYARNSEDGIGNVNPFGDPVKPIDQI